MLKKIPKMSVFQKKFYVKKNSKNVFQKNCVKKYLLKISNKCRLNFPNICVKNNPPMIFYTSCRTNFKIYF